MSLYSEFLKKIARKKVLIKKRFLYCCLGLISLLPIKLLSSSIPSNATVDYTGHGWECNYGYKLSDSACVKVEMPANAKIDYTGHGWECDYGYKLSDGVCVKVELPANAVLDYTGHNWKCGSGYKLAEGKCSPFSVPEHAQVDASGNDWICQLKFKRSGDGCIPMTSQEIIQQNITLSKIYACGNSHNYDVTGRCGDRRVRGDVDVCSKSKDVSGHLRCEDEDDNDDESEMESDFNGEWVGNDEIEGRDDNGNYCYLEVD